MRMSKSRMSNSQSIRRLARTLGGVCVLASALTPRSIVAQTPTKQPDATRLRFAISFPAARSTQPLDGRIILVISDNDRREPRFQNEVYQADTQLAFGIDV